MINNCTRRDCYFWTNDGNDMHYCNFINCQYIKTKDVKFIILNELEQRLGIRNE